MSSETTHTSQASSPFPRPGSAYYEQYNTPGHIAKHVRKVLFFQPLLVALYRMRILPLFSSLGSFVCLISSRRGQHERIPWTIAEHSEFDGVHYCGEANTMFGKSSNLSLHTATICRCS